MLKVGKKGIIFDSQYPYDLNKYYFEKGKKMAKTYYSK